MRQTKKEKEVLAKECQTLKMRLAEAEEARKKDRELYENTKTSTRQKYEKQLDHMKVEMVSSQEGHRIIFVSGFSILLNS